MPNPSIKIMKLYLSSYEYEDFTMPTKILQYHKIILDNRNILVIEVDKPLIGQKYGLLDYNPKTLYLINRVNENAFDKLDQFPIDVHVLIQKKKEYLSPSFLSQLQNIAWACVYNNEKDAKAHKI